MNRDQYADSTILDLSCGDGRNIEFLQHIGFKVYASEITESIVDKLRSDYPDVQFGVGYAHDLPFQDGQFDYVLARATCYYLEPGVSFRGNLAEISRILSADGVFIGLIPAPGNFLLDGAIELADGSVEVRSDPFALRNGCRIQAANSESHVFEMLSEYFNDICLGSCSDDWFGLPTNVYIFVCKNGASDKL